jgi:uncharacterized protein (DUF4415 family)
MRGDGMSKLTKQQIDELKALSDIPDKSIDTSDIPEVTDFSSAQIGKFYRPVKQTVTIRLDADIVEWFKNQDSRYQTHINRALRQYVQAHHKHP